MKILSISLLLCFLPYEDMAQVRDIIEDVETDKEKGSHTGTSGIRSGSGGYDYYDDGDESIGTSIIESIFKLIFVGIAKGVVEGQKAALRHRAEHRERISLEIPASYGWDISSIEEATYFNGGIKGNWGIIGSDFRYSILRDSTGSLRSFDWLVGVVRIPIKGFKIEYGLGYTRLLSLDMSYMLSSIGFDWRMKKSDITIASSYQWSGKTELESRYKQSFNFRIDKEIYRSEYFHLSPFFEYRLQHYFANNRMNFLNIGVIVRIY